MPIILIFVKTSYLLARFEMVNSHPVNYIIVKYQRNGYIKYVNFSPNSLSDMPYLLREGGTVNGSVVSRIESDYVLIRSGGATWRPRHGQAS